MKKLSAALCFFGASFCFAKELFVRIAPREEGSKGSINEINGRLDYIDNRLDAISDLVSQISEKNNKNEQ